MRLHCPRLWSPGLSHWSPWLHHCPHRPCLFRDDSVVRPGLEAGRPVLKLWLIHRPLWASVSLEHCVPPWAAASEGHYPSDLCLQGKSKHFSCTRQPDPGAAPSPAFRAFESYQSSPSRVPPTQSLSPRAPGMLRVWEGLGAELLLEATCWACRRGVCVRVCVRACVRACVWPRPCSGAAAPVASEKRQTNSPAEPPGPRSRLGRDAAPLQAPFPVLTLSRQGRRGS